MSDIPKQIIVETDDSGKEYARVNPEYKEYVKKEKYYLRLKRSKIPEAYWNIDFEHYLGDREELAYKQILYYAQHCYEQDFNNVHLYIYGIHSSQKTTLACNILKESLKQGKEAKFILASDLIKKLMKVQGFGRDEEIEREIQELKQASIICIDDVFDPDKTLMWKNSENKNIIISAWDDFIRSVIVSKTKIIMTSNFDFSIINQYYGKSLLELVERNFYPIELRTNIKHVAKNKLSDAFKDIQ